MGKGFVQTEHGKLSVPSPAVIELLSKTNIKVSASFDSIEAELSTPTGIALIANIVDSYQLPRSYSIKSYGVGLGSLQFQFPNLVRVLKIKSDIGNYLNQNLIQDMRRFLYKKHGLMTRHQKILLALFRN